MKKRISKYILRTMGWGIVDAEKYPRHIPKKVLIAIPHTSWFDFIVGVLVRSAMDIDVHFIGKKSLFVFPLGILMRYLGGIPVNRSKRSNFTDSIVEKFKTLDRVSVVLAPEGTRKKVEKLKTGFYFIAEGAQVPIIMIKFDYGKKLVTFREPFYTTGDMDADMQVVKAYFKGVQGRFPEYSFG